MPVLIWIDREHARLLRFSPSTSMEISSRSSIQFGGSYFDVLSEKLEDASRILIVGPGVSKFRLFAHLRETAPQIARKVVTCEELDHPNELQLRSLAEKYLGVISNTSWV